MQKVNLKPKFKAHLQSDHLSLALDQAPQWQLTADLKKNIKPSTRKLILHFHSSQVTSLMMMMESFNPLYQVFMSIY